MRRLISEMGYEPRQRDNWYNLVDEVSPAPAVVAC
jgi:hypothetical protein